VTLTAFRRETKAGDRPPRNRRRVVGIAVSIAVVLAVFGTWLIAFSSVFGVRTVEVHGVHLLSAAQVRAAADVKNGTPLVRVDTSAITRRIEQLAEVESAQVSTSFPSTVVITIEERVPVGYVLRAGHVRLVDHSGLEYRTVGSAPLDLPRLAVPTGKDEQRTAAAVAAVAAALPARIRRQINSIQALDPDSITLVLTRGRIVRWGSAGRTAEKAQLLPALLKQRGVHDVDLTDPDQPFTR
jgi:cell division protein FtsQ